MKIYSRYDSTKVIHETSADTLEGAYLRGAIMPDGRTFEAWQQDPLEGLCTEPEVRRRAVEAWGNHSWKDCPMHAAYGWDGMEQVPAERRINVATFVALFDGGKLEKPE